MRQHGITTSTINNLIIDSGRLFFNYGESNVMDIGATRGGSTFTVEQEIRTMEFDGMRGQMIGSHRLLGSIPKLTANIVGWSKEIIAAALPGATWSDNTTHYRITRTIRKLIASDYYTNAVIVAETTVSDYNMAVYGVKNAIQLENIEFPFSDKDETVCTMVFSGSTSISDMDEEPYWIDYPQP